MILSGLKTLLETGEPLTTPGSLRYSGASERLLEALTDRSRRRRTRAAPRSAAPPPDAVPADDAQAQGRRFDLEGAGEDVRPEPAGVGRARVAEVRKAEQVLERPQRREVVVRRGSSPFRAGCRARAPPRRRARRRAPGRARRCSACSGTAPRCSRRSRRLCSPSASASSKVTIRRPSRLNAGERDDPRHPLAAGRRRR